MLLPTFLKAYAHGYKHEPKFKEQLVFLQKAHTAPLMPGTKFLLP